MCDLTREIEESIKNSGRRSSARSGRWPTRPIIFNRPLNPARGRRYRSFRTEHHYSEILYTQIRRLRAANRPRSRDSSVLYERETYSSLSRKTIYRVSRNHLPTGFFFLSRIFRSSRIFTQAAQHIQSIS